MFVVGKEYICASGLRAICLVSYHQDGYDRMFGKVTKSDGIHHSDSHHTFSGSYWKEYHEPVVKKITRRLFEYGNVAKDGYAVSTVDMPGLNEIGSFELTITDGKLTGVRIV